MKRHPCVEGQIHACMHSFMGRFLRKCTFYSAIPLFMIVSCPATEVLQCSCNWSVVCRSLSKEDVLNDVLFCTSCSSLSIMIRDDHPSREGNIRWRETSSVLCCSMLHQSWLLFKCWSSLSLSLSLGHMCLCPSLMIILTSKEGTIEEKEGREIVNPWYRKKRMELVCSSCSLSDSVAAVKVQRERSSQRRLRFWVSTTEGTPRKTLPWIMTAWSDMQLSFCKKEKNFCCFLLSCFFSFLSSTFVHVLLESMLLILTLLSHSFIERF